MSSHLKSWALWGTGVSVAVLIAGASIYFNLPQGANAAPASETAAAPAIPVTVATVKPRNVTTWQEFSGRLEAVDRVQIRSRVAGAIQATHFREGSLVKVGDLLVTIDPEPYLAAVAQAEGQVASAQAKVDLASTELERGRNLAARNTISQSDLAQRQGTQSEALANLQSAKAALKTAQLDLGYTEIRAPITGKVGKMEITVGNLVAAGSASMPLTTIISSDPIYASFDVNEELVSRTLSELTAVNNNPAIEDVPVELTTLSSNSPALRGKLQLIGNEVNATSGTIRVRAVVDNPGGKLIPGQFVRVRMGQPKAQDHLLVSEKAVGTDQDKKFVFVVDDKNTVGYRQVELGLAVDGQRIIEKGINAGDRVVVNGLQRIRPGAVVAPQEDTKVATK